jgi:hypothetical protein
MINRQRKFRMEQLEARQMMAGDVTAVVNNFGDLRINEASANVGQASDIQLSLTQNGQIRVESLSPGNSLVNGQSFQDFDVTGNVHVILGGGNDRVRVDGLGFNPLSHREVHIMVDSWNGSTPDDDVVNVYDVDMKGLMRIQTGAGNDHVHVESTRIVGDSTRIAGDGLKIETGAGQDNVRVALWSELDGLDVQTYDSLAETDADEVHIQDTSITGTGETLRVRLGGGDDEFSLAYVDVYNDNDIDIHAGAGNDTGSFSHVDVVDEVMIQMGTGSDNLDLQYSTARRLSALGGTTDSGIDSLTTRNRWGTDTNNFTTRVFDGWEWINGVRPMVLRNRILTI